jgi:ATP-dependent DNA helicase DinG
MATLHTALQQSEMVLRSISEESIELNGLRERASHLAAELDVFSHPVQEGWVRWIEIGERLKLVQSPMDIADTMRSKFIQNSPFREGSKSLIFTSATLGHDATLAHFLESCGLQGARVLQAQSPFDFRSQAALYVPANMPKPSDATHSESVADLIITGAMILGGRTLVLTTTLRAMGDIAERLRRPLASLSGIEVLVQGESSKRELTERFRSSPCGDTKGFILVATASFWEGVDIPGDALQMVVIDKLPFPPPHDPLVAARSRNLVERGKNAFQHLHVPHAALALKQGAGRLIRRETDRGVLVVCDVRLTQMGYGRRIIAALPAMNEIGSEEEFVQALNALTKPSTKAH